VNRAFVGDFKQLLALRRVEFPFDRNFAVNAVHWYVRIFAICAVFGVGTRLSKLYRDTAQRKLPAIGEHA
jgi:hypothetical protein